jgi:hypothetical protein
MMDERAIPVVGLVELMEANSNVLIVSAVGCIVRIAWWTSTAYFHYTECMLGLLFFFLYSISADKSCSNGQGCTSKIRH